MRRGRACENSDRDHGLGVITILIWAAPVISAIRRWRQRRRAGDDAAIRDKNSESLGEAVE